VNWHGKLIGAVLGLVLTKRPFGLVIGLILGHLYDMGVFSGSVKPKPERPPPPVAPAADDPYVLLGVAPAASDEELEQAYRRLMSEYHPDRVANAAKEIRDIADRRTREINQAYDSIRRERGI
jgi:hypothetical protein